MMRKSLVFIIAMFGCHLLPGQDIVVTVTGDTLQMQLIDENDTFYFFNHPNKPDKEIKYPKTAISEVIEKRYIDEDANGNWLWKEVITFDPNKYEAQDIIDNIAQWLDRKRALFNTLMTGEYESFQMDENILEKEPTYLKGYLHGRIQPKVALNYFVRLYIDVEVRKGRFRVSFYDMTLLGVSALGTARPPENPRIFTSEEVETEFTKTKGKLSLDETMGRLINQIQEDALRVRATKDEDDW